MKMKLPGAAFGIHSPRVKILNIFPREADCVAPSPGGAVRRDSRQPFSLVDLCNTSGVLCAIYAARVCVCVCFVSLGDFLFYSFGLFVIGLLVMVVWMFGGWEGMCRQ